MHPHSRLGHGWQRQGFTLVEVLIATALLGFSLVVMFGYHAQATRSNSAARKLTDCTYLAQGQLEELMSIEWDDAVGRSGTDLGAGNSGATDWDPLYHPSNGSQPTAVNSLMEEDGSESTNAPAATYYITWEMTETTQTDWVKLHVRCTWEDRTFATWHGTTVSSYRYRDQ